MKASEKRHELQKNELADWLGRHIEDVKPHFMPIMVISLVIVAAIVGVFIFWGGQSSAGASAWNSYFTSFSEREPEDALKKVIDAQQGNVAALWARQSLADIKLAEGDAQLFRDRKQAEESLAAAERLYKEVIDANPDEMLLTRARYGLARVYESQCKPEEARKLYDTIAKAQGDAARGQAAAKNAARLSDERNVELLAWFANQTPKPPPPMTSPFGNPAGPGSDLPTRPDISIPDSLGLGAPGEPKIGDVPGTPAVSDQPLVDQKPAEAKPGEPAPAAKSEPAKAEPAKPESPKPDETKAEKSPADDSKPDQPKADKSATEGDK